jgi:pyridoxine 4-dehydrogenase
MRRSEPRIVLGLHRSRHERLTIEHALEHGIRSIDTAFNYHHFESHRKLAQVAGDLLAEFTISSKVGYFPGHGGRPVHSLDAAQLRDALARSVEELGQIPSVVFLHNPERAILDGELDDPSAPYERIAEACAVLDRARAEGLCQSWGWSCWDTRPILSLLTETPGIRDVPGPRVLMTRAGLLVPAGVLEASERITDFFSVEPAARWGMSPFGGRVTDPLWDNVKPQQFLAPDQPASRAQAVLRVAFALPEVGRIAVGTDDPAHLDELVASLDLAVNQATIARYRALLRARTPTPTR